MRHTHVDLNGKAAKRQLVGKTIERVDAQAVNVLRLFFTDGTAYAIEVEAVGLGISGMVGCVVCAGDDS